MKGLICVFVLLILTSLVFADDGFKIYYDHIEFNGDRDDSLAYLTMRRAGAAADTFVVIDTTGSVWFINYYPKMESLFIDNTAGGLSAVKYTLFKIDSLFAIQDSFGTLGAYQGMIFDHFKQYRQRIWYDRYAANDSLRKWTITTFNSNHGPELKIEGEGTDNTGNAYGPKIITDGASIFFRLPYFYSSILDEGGRFEVWGYDSTGEEDSLKTLLQIKGYFAPKLEWYYGMAYFFDGMSVEDSFFIPQFNGGLPATPSSGFFGADTANDTIISMLGGNRVVVYPQNGDSTSIAGFNFANYGYAGTFTATQKIQFDASGTDTGLAVIIDTAGTDRDAHGVSVSGESFDDANDYAYEYKNKDGDYRFYVKGDGYTWCYNNMATAGTFTAGNFIAGTTIYGTKFTAPSNQDLIVAHGETDEFTLFGTENPTGGIYFIAHGDALADTSGTFMHLDSLDLRLSGLSLTGSALIRGSDAFGASKTADTVVISGATATDYYWVTAETSAPAGYWYVVAKTDTLIVNSSAAESSTPYNWLRMK